MTASILILLVAIGLALAMTAAWRIAVKTGQSGWIDAIWTFATGAAGVIAALMPLDGVPSLSARQWLVAAMAAVWSLRLGSHIVARTRRGGDDPRYAQLRKVWGNAWKSRLLWFLQVQAGAALLLAVTILAASRNPAAALGVGDAVGVLIFAVSLWGAATADRQLSRFASDPSNKGKVAEIGLWRWSRHPNYFFEWLGWVSYAAIAFNTAYPWGFAALIGPVLMYTLLVHVSGIPPLEEHMQRTRGAAFTKYQKRVNAFFPGPPGREGKTT